MGEEPVNKPARVVGAATAATIGIGVGGPLGAVVGAAISEAVINLTGKAWNEITAARRLHAAAVVETASNELNEDPEHLVERALAQPETAALLADALAAAAHTFSQRKVAALGKCVANGLRDDGARVDPERLMVLALADIEEPHVKALLSFRRGNWWMPHDLTGIQSALGDATTGTARAVIGRLERNSLIVLDDQKMRTANPGGRSPIVRDYAAPRTLTAATDNREWWSATQFGADCAYRLGEPEPQPAKVRPYVAD